jgi:hypothetical protein
LQNLGIVHGLDFPLNPSIFRILRHIEYFKDTKQYGKIIALGTRSSAYYSTHPSILIYMTEAALHLSLHNQGLQFAKWAGQFAQRRNLHETYAEAQFLESCALFYCGDYEGSLNVCMRALTLYMDLSDGNERDGPLAEDPICEGKLRKQLIKAFVHRPVSFRQIDSLVATNVARLRTLKLDIEVDRLYIYLAQHHLLLGLPHTDLDRSQKYLDKVSIQTSSGTSDYSKLYALTYARLEAMRNNDLSAYQYYSTAKNIALSLGMQQEIPEIDNEISDLSLSNEEKAAAHPNTSRMVNV